MAASGAARPRGSRSAPAPWVYDALLAAGVSLTLAAFIAADVENTRPAAWAYLWAAGFGALMFIRRSNPTLVVMLSVVGFVAYYATGFTAIGTAVPIAAAVFSAAECGKLAAAAAGSAVVTAISVAYRLGTGQDPAFVLGYDLPQNLLILAGAVALGDSIRTRRELQRQSAHLAELTAEQSRRAAQEVMAAERLAVSHDLHDSIGHSLAVISLHAEVAREAAEDGVGRQHALDVIRATTAGAAAELRHTVAGLRRDGPPGHSLPGLGSLPAALVPAEAAGLEVYFRNELRAGIPESRQTALYRITQEAVTNIVRHSNADRVWVRLTREAGSVRLQIVDDGSRPGRAAAEPGGNAGYGLAGLRERTESLGGNFHAGWTPAGFEVTAVLPLEQP